MATSETITVSIFDKDYPVSCPADEVQALRDSAFYLDQKMREIKKSGSVLGLDRLAVMAALNITNDFCPSTERIKPHGCRLRIIMKCLNTASSALMP